MSLCSLEQMALYRLFRMPVPWFRLRSLNWKHACPQRHPTLDDSVCSLRLLHLFPFRHSALETRLLSALAAAADGLLVAWILQTVGCSVFVLFYFIFLQPALAVKLLSSAPSLPESQCGAKTAEAAESICLAIGLMCQDKKC